MSDRSQRRRVNLADVAGLAGVSTATASRALRGVARVSDDTRRRVLQAADELAYLTSLPAASAPGIGPARTVAVIVPFFNRWYFATVTAAAVDHLRAHGYDVMLYHLGNPDVRDHFFTRLPLADRVDGILSLAMPLTDRHTLALRALGLPLVSVGSHIPGAPSVGIDDVETARQAVNHLYNLRHRRIGLIASRPDDRRFDFISSIARRMGYEEALGAVGLDFEPSLVVEGPHGIAGGAEAMVALLNRPELPTAVLAEFDELAIGALWALRRARLRVPEDVSVISIDNHEMAEFVDLTTFDQDAGGQGEIAARLLLAALEPNTNEASDEAIVVPTRLVLRGSTAPPSGADEQPAGPDAEPLDHD